MTLRLLDLFRIGLGPSSSHTVGPMRAARFFREACLARQLVPDRVEVDLKGSLSATGRGHGTDKAVMAGLHGWEPETCEVDAVHALPTRLAADPKVPWGAGTTVVRPEDIRFLRYVEYRDERLPHPNTAVFRAHQGGRIDFEQTWCSVGGGFVQEPGADSHAFWRPPASPPRYPFHDCASLVAAAEAIGGTLGDVVLANESEWDGSPGATGAGLDRVWDAFRACIQRGLQARGELPGGLGVRRRGAELLHRVEEGHIDSAYAPVARAQAYAFAVNEENAAGGRVVTAPTNGAAGIVPGVLVEAAERLGLDRAAVHNALATAGAVGMLVKTHASISGAEVGCQGEVGTATAMAAAALCQILGGNPKQVENAAEIAIEHNLGLTCDPIKGLVQAPCIERNAMGVAKAWSAAQLSLHSVVSPVISLDRVIRVMKRTGDDMRREYKETSEGGLAVSLPEC
ncbi:MAG: L-serine ammonia-lyase [Gemmatimonadota bacterium]|nr:MAG: L-serine ammonia-lyase [Gemmatimonadota bacterium]